MNREIYKLIETLKTIGKEGKIKKMKISALASGSLGNCFYISNGKSNEGILIDAGISSKQIVERLGKIGGNPEKIKGIFITHEHIDHIRGADVFAREFNVPVFATKKTARSKILCSNEKLIRHIKNNESVKVGGMTIQAFPKSHDAIDPVSYSVSGNAGRSEGGKKRVSVITDVGYGCKNVIENVSNSDFLCLESNHDEKMLESGPYPYYLKKLIKSDLGHLSNKQAALCVLEHSSIKLKKVILSHLSKTNNTPEIAMKTFNYFLKERQSPPDVHLSLREEPTQLFRI